jgi:hypothetical protein
VEVHVTYSRDIGEIGFDDSYYHDPFYGGFDYDLGFSCPSDCDCYGYDDALDADNVEDFDGMCEHGRRFERRCYDCEPDMVQYEIDAIFDESDRWPCGHYIGAWTRHECDRLTKLDCDPDEVMFGRGADSVDDADIMYLPPERYSALLESPRLSQDRAKRFRRLRCDRRRQDHADGPRQRAFQAFHPRNDWSVSPAKLRRLGKRDAIDLSVAEDLGLDLEIGWDYGYDYGYYDPDFDSDYAELHSDDDFGRDSDPDYFDYGFGDELGPYDLVID